MGENPGVYLSSFLQEKICFNYKTVSIKNIIANSKKTHP